jgi:hypothetical protein
MPRRPPIKPSEETAAEAPLPAEERQPRSRWKHFVLEFLSVAAGVLLALIVDQAAENWREHRRVVDQREAMDKEIAAFGEIFRLRIRLAPCITSKLDSIEAFVGGRGPSAPLSNIGRPSFFFTGRGAWNGDNSDQVSRYLGSDRFQLYSEIYQGMEQYSALSAEEQSTWVPFLALEGDTDALAPDRRTRLREALAQARNQHLLMNAIATQMLDQARGLGVATTGELAAKAKEAIICKPLATARPHEPAGAPDNAGGRAAKGKRAN